MESFYDRRKYQRFTAKCGADIVLNKPLLLNFGRTHKTKFGTLVDISKGGFSTQYISTRKRSKKLPAIIITMPGEDFGLDKIPVNTITEFMKNEFLDSTKIWQRGVQFQNLTKFQKLQLEYFINTWTNGFVKDRRTQRDRRITNQYVHYTSLPVYQDRRTWNERRRLAQNN
ncbi:MAG: hypothetical protein R6X10_19310 [Desulfobacterales bacterium]